MQVKWPERMAHTIPEPDHFVVSQRGVVPESCFFQVFPGIGYLKSQVMVPVTGDFAVQYLFQTFLLPQDLLRVIEGIVAPVEPDFPPPVVNLAKFVLQILNSVPEARDVGIGSKEVERGAGTVFLLHVHNLPEVPVGAFFLSVQFPENLLFESRKVLFFYAGQGR